MESVRLERDQRETEETRQSVRAKWISSWEAANLISIRCLHRAPHKDGILLYCPVLGLMGNATPEVMWNVDWA